MLIDEYMLYKNKIIDKYKEIKNKIEEIIKKYSTKSLNDNVLFYNKSKVKRFTLDKIIDKIYSLGKKNGALGGKLLGAGAGGFLLFYVKQDKRNKLIKALKNYSCVDFNFINFGSTVTKL